MLITFGKQTQLGLHALPSTTQQCLKYLHHVETTGDFFPRYKAMSDSVQNINQSHDIITIHLNII